MTGVLFLIKAAAYYLAGKKTNDMYRIAKDEFDVDAFKSHPKEEIQRVAHVLKIDGFEQPLQAFARNWLGDLFATPDKLRVPGLDTLIGEYMVDGRVPATQAEEAGYFLTELGHNQKALPYNLQLGKGKNSRVRKQIMEDFAGYAVTSVDMLIELLEEETEKDPGVKTELKVLSRYRESLAGLEEEIISR